MINLPEQVRRALARLEAAGHEAFVVGGAVRDCVRGVFPEEQKEELKEILTEEEYESLFRWETASFQVKWKCLSK